MGGRFEGQPSTDTLSSPSHHPTYFVSWCTRACTCILCCLATQAQHREPKITLQPRDSFISVTPHPPQLLLVPEHVFLAMSKNLSSESPPVLLTYSPVGAQGTASGLTTSAIESIVGQSILRVCIYCFYSVRETMLTPFILLYFILKLHLCRRLLLGDGGVNLQTKQHIHCTRGGTLAFFLFY